MCDLAAGAWHRFDPDGANSGRSPSPRTVTFDLSDTIDGEDVPFALDM